MNGIIWELCFIAEDISVLNSFLKIFVLEVLLEYIFIDWMQGLFKIFILDLGILFEYGGFRIFICLILYFAVYPH